MMRSYRLVLALYLLTTSLLLAGLLRPPSSAGGRDASAPVVAYHGQSDDAVIAQLPELDLSALISAKPGLEPRLLLRSAQGEQQRPQAAGAIELAALLPGPAYPDTLLLHSGDWYGSRLRQAAARMGLVLSEQQLSALETIAAVQGVNTRLLLSVAQVTGAPGRYPARQDWIRWLYLQSVRVRTALGPFALDQQQLISFHDGTLAGWQPESGDTARWALATMLGAGKSAAETVQALQSFEALYAVQFGDPALDEARPAATSPFLQRPFDVQPNGRGYYDHTYPTVDFIKNPNLPGMRDYLGRTTTSYDSHDGDDFWLPYGSPIYAPVSGPVLWDSTSWAPPSDQALLIGHGGAGYPYHIYIGHLSTLYATTGSYVTQGQLIARSGNPGTVPHIHFEVRHNGKQTDTMGWYGGGDDPCPAANPEPTPSTGYKGCEASSWLWATPPEISLTAPANGIVVSGMITATAVATDTLSGVTAVRFSLLYDGSWHDMLDADGADGWGASWNLTTVADQAGVQLTAWAYNQGGVAGQAQTINLILNQARIFVPLLSNGTAERAAEP